MVNGTDITYWANGRTASTTTEPSRWNAQLKWENGSPVLTLNGARISGDSDNTRNSGIYTDGDMEYISTEILI